VSNDENHLFKVKVWRIRRFLCIAAALVLQRQSDVALIESHDQQHEQAIGCVMTLLAQMVVTT
jgi:hypothetical protein